MNKNEYDEAEDADRMNRRFDDPRRQAELDGKRKKKRLTGAALADALSSPKKD